MATKNQHFVPQVYLKAWETTVFSIKEPTKPFNGVYKYSKQSLSLGDGCNKKNLLSSNHTYTIDEEQLFLLNSCPEIKTEFLTKLKEILSKRNITVYCNDTRLRKNSDYLDNLKNLETWQFRRDDNSLASQKAILSEIRGIHCYCIEDKFSSFMEQKWESILADMLSAFPASGGSGQLEVKLSMQNIESMLTMISLMMCRNPAFSLYGLFDWVDALLSETFNQWDDVAEKEKCIGAMRRGFWLSQIYKGLFQDPKGFVEVFTKSAINGLGIIVFRVRDDNEGNFITSDNPVVHYNCILHTQNKRGIYFPLTPRVLLFMGKNTNGCIEDVIFRTVTNQDVRSLNRIILNGASEHIVSNYRRLGNIL